MMTDIQPNADSNMPPRRLRWTIGLAGAAAAAAVALLVFGPRFGAPAPSPSDEGIGGSAGGGTASCIRFDLELLAQQEFAFDGTVTGIDGESVTFDVGKWYRGSGDPSVSLTQVGQGDGAVMEGILVDFQVGNRYLVSGAGGVVTGCGYSQAWDASAAADWQSAFGS
jgi:hypothetical protein